MLPFARGSETSRKAALSSCAAAPSTRLRIFEWVKARRAHGATIDEIERALGLTHQNASARVWELRGCKRSGKMPTLLIDSGRVRNTRTGRPATVWVAA